jgi:hypothetical protein
MESCDASIAFSSEVDTGSREENASNKELSRFGSVQNADHLSIGQLPGCSQTAGVARVLADASLEGGPSMPFTTAVTRQR